MSKTKRSQARASLIQTVDLYEGGDRLYSYNPLVMSRQTESRSAGTPQAQLYLVVFRSGWMKPTVQLSMLLGLEKSGNLTIGGMRRLHKLLASQSTDVQNAAVSRSHIHNDPSFWALKAWVNRPLSFSSYTKKEKRRIGVGYRDKGTLPPNHTKGRNQQPDAIYLGEKMEWIWDLKPEVALLVQDYGYLLNHLGNGWWEPDHRLRYLMVVRKLLD